MYGKVRKNAMSPTPPPECEVSVPEPRITCGGGVDVDHQTCHQIPSTASITLLYIRTLVLSREVIDPCLALLVLTLLCLNMCLGGG